MLAVAYAALQPSSQLLNRYMFEIDRLEVEGRITERDHQVLRSSPLAQDELMHLTLGDDVALNEETVLQTLERVTSEIKREESEKLTQVQEQHEKTRESLILQQSRTDEIVSKIYWRCRDRANVVAWTFSVVISIGLVIALVVAPLVGFGWESWTFRICASVLIALTLFDLLFGGNVTQLHQWIRHRCWTWLLRRESTAIGIDFDSRAP